ncbi:MAG: PH domain-containing protein [Gammaproteobacteria bacterium]|nr:PH domain-containing protein [Gammaproteobacteria bacterium]
MSEVAINLVVSPSMRTFIWAFILIVILPVLVTGGAVYFTNKVSMIGITSSVTLLSIILFAALVYFLLKTEILLDTQTLNVKAAFYERNVNLSDIIWANSHIIDLSNMPEFTPRVRVNGIGLPGYRAGWFRLANGSQAFLLVTHGPLAYLPVQGGKDFLLSIKESSPLFEKIKSSDSGVASSFQE